MQRVHHRPIARREPSPGAAHAAGPPFPGGAPAPAELAFEAAADAMLVLDDDRTLLVANAAARSLLGDGPGRAIDAALSESWAELLANGGGSGRCELAPAVALDFTLAAALAPGRHLLTLRDDPAPLVARLRRQLIEAQSVGGFGHWEWDLHTGAVEWSDELHRICGLEPGAVATFADVHDRVHADDRDATRAVVEKARVDGERFAHEFRVVRPDGSVGVIESRGEVVRAADGAPVRMFGTAQDVTERVDAEAERRNFSTILDGSDDAISACSLDGILISWNRGAEKLYGYAAEEAIGRSVTMLLPPEEHGAAWTQWRRCMGGEHVEPFESDRITKDGRRLVVAVTLSPIADASGAIIGVAAVGRDMTEQKRTQAALAGAHATAVEASRLKSEFMANMNHELRTPLNGVIGVSRLLLATALDDEQREYVEALQVSGEALMAVIEDILDFSKIEAGKLTIESEPLELAPLMEDVCSMVALSQPARRVEVISAIPVGIPDVVWGDAKRIRQVLTNLTNNALKFTQSGHVAVSVAVAGERDAETLLRFEVADTGIGIDAAVQASIFESFSQADGSTTRRFGGTGLGLTIAKQLVLLMGGEIGVSSAPGAGSTFHFTLPARAAGPAQEPAAGDPLRGRRALIVDDKQLNRTVLTQRLGHWGVTVGAAADSAGALAALREAARSGEPYEVALIDYRMESASGRDLVDVIRADPQLRSTAVVMMVAARDSHVASAVNDVEGVVAKPIHLAALHDELARVVLAAPRASRLEAAPQQHPAAPAARVLIAEDNPVNQLVAVRLLEQRGLAVDVAGDGREALELFAANCYDAIFMDCQMPELDGYDATREIRRREGDGPRIPIIAMTASTLPGDTERCLAAGMDHYTAKPINPGELDAVLMRALGRRWIPAGGAA